MTEPSYEQHQQLEGKPIRLLSDIKPETRANKAEVAGESPEQPNQSIMIIEEIEGLISQLNDKLDELDGGHYAGVKAVKKAQVLEEIDIFQKTILFELRKAFE